MGEQMSIKFMNTELHIRLETLYKFTKMNVRVHKSLTGQKASITFSSDFDKIRAICEC